MDAVETGDDAMINANIGMIAALATRQSVVSIGNMEFGQVGGAMGYGVDFNAAFRSATGFDPLRILSINTGAPMAERLIQINDSLKSHP